MSEMQHALASDATYAKALRFVLRWEGGYVNDPADAGGATNKGITQAVYNTYLASLGRPPRSVQFITDQEVEAIYRRNYWQAAHCPDLPGALAIAQFETAVNMGVGRAIGFLQKSLGVPVDRRYGPQTDAAVKQCNPSRTLEKYLSLREQFYYRLAYHGLRKFLRGWLNRMGALRKLLASETDVVDWFAAATPAEIEAMLRKILNEGTAFGQKNWAGTSKAALASLQVMDNLLRQQVIPKLVVLGQAKAIIDTGGPPDSALDDAQR